MFKVLGVIFILFSLGVFTYRTVEQKKRQLTNLKEMKKAITFLKHELTFSMPEMATLCKKVAQKTEGDISKAFLNTEKIIHNDSSIDFSNAWQMTIEDKKLFSPAAEREILDFSKEFGKKTLEIELENLKKYESELHLLEENEKEKYLNDKKVTCTLGAAMGAVLVILVI